MADTVQITPGVGATILTDEVTDGTLGTGQVQWVKVIDGTVNGTNKQIVNASGAALVAFPSAQAVTVSSGTLTISSGTVSVSGAVDASGATVPTNEVKSATSTLTSVAASAASVQLLAANASRKQAMFYNEGSTTCYLKLGTTASNTSYTIQIATGGYYEVYGYTGRIDGIWAGSPTSSMRITELT